MNEFAEILNLFIANVIAYTFFVAVYGFIRIVFDLLGEPMAWWWGGLVLALGGITAVLGVLYALMQHDLKRLLAYHNIYGSWSNQHMQQLMVILWVVLIGLVKKSPGIFVSFMVHLIASIQEDKYLHRHLKTMMNC